MSGKIIHFPAAKKPAPDRDKTAPEMPDIIGSVIREMQLRRRARLHPTPSLNQLAPAPPKE